MMQPDPTAPAVPLLRYPGAKNRLARWIINHLPADHDTYNEPFAGSAAVLFRKPRSPMEAINDRAGDVVNLFRMLRDRTDELVQAIERTPWALDEYERCRSAAPAGDPLEQARRFYFRCWASIRPFDYPHGSWRRQTVRSRGRDGSRPPMTPAARLFTRTDHLHALADRLRGVAVDNMDALDFINRYDNPRALFYVDPPYLDSTRRTSRPHYPVLFGSPEQHRDLAYVLTNLEGMVVLSHYPCALYADLYEAAGWRRVDRRARIDGDGMATEALYLCPRTQEALGEQP